MSDLFPQETEADVSPRSPTSLRRQGYPFPNTASRPIARQEYSARRSSIASTSSSIGGSLDIAQRSNNHSGFRAISQNAISTLLQPPGARTGMLPNKASSNIPSGFKAPTQKDIPPVTLTNVEHVPPEKFRDYLNRIGPLFDSLQRGRAEHEQPAWLKRDKELEKTDRFADALQRRWSRESVASPTAPRVSTPGSTLSPIESPTHNRRSSAARSRKNRNEPTLLSTIPTVYFEEDFHLENPRTFDVVSEHAEVVRPPPGTPRPEQQSANGAPLPRRRPLATNAILQEKLSWYMDTVEVHLIDSISAASTGFFTALGSLKELQSEAEESVAKIQGLREDLRKLDQEIAVGGLEIAAKRRRKANLAKLENATAQVQSVVANVQRADELVDSGSFDEAAEQMQRVGRLLCGIAEPSQSSAALMDLRPMKALQGLDSGLQELQLRIGTGFANRFTATLMDDLREHVEKIPKTDTLKRWSRQRGIPPMYMETSDDFRSKLTESLKRLQVAGHMAPATAAYREAVVKEMKAIIRKHLPSSSDDDADSMVSVSTRGGAKLSQQDKSSILARNLRAMDAEDCEILLINVYTSVGEALRRVSTQTKILLDVTSSVQASRPKSPAAAPPRTPIGPPGEEQPHTSILRQADPNQNDLAQVLDMSSLLEQAVDAAQTQITRILKVRNEQSIRLPRERFLRYFTLNRLFADECEAVSGRGGQALKAIINAQISGFVQVLGTAKTEKVANLLDIDTWNAEDFSERDNEILQRILSSMSSDPPYWTTRSSIWEELARDVPLPDEERNINGTSTPNGQPPSKTTFKPAYIDDTQYILVHSVIGMLGTIDTLLSLTSSMPSVTPQISNTLLEVLRTYNSRCCQLILGAGATRSAGLKNITTKHLALASQSLSFIVALVPYMRECARRHLPSGQTGVLAEFDKTKRLYQDHQSGIHDKLVEIMTTRSQAHVKAMSAIDFDAQVDNDKPSPYVETLTKETLTLHRVLSRHLSKLDVSIIMRQIFASYKTQWTTAFREVQASNEVGTRALLRDAEAISSRLEKVDGFGDFGNEIVDAVKGKLDGKDTEKSSAEELGKKS